MRRLPVIFFLFMLLQLQCRFPTVRLDDYAVHGIDVSHHQARIDWSMLVGAGLDFAFLKATEGGDWHDSLFCYNWESVRETGLLRGAYHFYRPGKSPLVQAENFIARVHLEPGDLPPVLDIEVTDGRSKGQIIHDLKLWLLEMEIHYNTRPIIYTNLKFYYQYLAGHFEEYPLWIARYHFREPNLAAGREWDFWQYGNRGELPGIAGPVDFNVFRGSREELNAYCIRPNVLSFAE